MKRKIVIVHCASTGFNYVDDIRSRGYEPVIVKVAYAGTEEDKALTATQDMADCKRFKGIQVIPYNSDYQIILDQVRAVSPILILAGSEFGVELALRLSNDLGLPSNPKGLLRAMTHKNAMHEALKEYGIRYIRGKVVKTLEEAMAFYESLSLERAVVKRTRGFGTQGVTLCDNRNEFITAVQKELSMKSTMDTEPIDIMVQERIMGEEYMISDSAPVVSLCRSLKSYHSSIFDRVEIDFRSLGDPINPLLPPDDSSDNSLDNKRYLGLKLLHEMSDKLDYEYVMGMNCTHAEIALPGN